MSNEIPVDPFTAKARELQAEWVSKGVVIINFAADGQHSAIAVSLAPDVLPGVVAHVLRGLADQMEAQLEAAAKVGGQGL